MPDASRLAMAGLVLATLAPTPVTAAPEGRFEKSLSVSGPVTLSVTSGSGSIKISSGADGTVRVIGTVRGNSGSGAGSDDEVTRAVKAVETSPPIVQQGNTIKLGTIDDEAISRRVSVSFEVTVPRTTSVTARTGSGSQDIASLAGSVSAHTGSGAITIGAVEGAVEARSGSGRVEVAAGKERVSIATGSGEVKVGRVEGTVSIRTGSGSISVAQATAGSVDAATGSGSIAVDSLSGGLTARSASGTITVAGTPGQDWQLHSSSGSIALDIPDGTPFRVEASTSSGRINTDHKLTVSSVGQRELSGAVGDGGRLVSARTSSGSIHIRKGAR